MVDYTPGKGTSRTESHVAGLWLGRESTGAGYRHHTELHVANECQIVFLIDSDEQFAEARALIESTLEINEGEICVAEQ